MSRPLPDWPHPSESGIPKPKLVPKVFEVKNRQGPRERDGGNNESRTRLLLGTLQWASATYSPFFFMFFFCLPSCSSFFSPENYDPTCLPSQRAGQYHTLGDSHPGLDPDKPVATEERSREIGGDGGKKKGGWDLVH